MWLTCPPVSHFAQRGDANLSNSLLGNLTWHPAPSLRGASLSGALPPLPYPEGSTQRAAFEAKGVRGVPQRLEFARFAQFVNVRRRAPEQVGDLINGE